MDCTAVARTIQGKAGNVARWSLIQDINYGEANLCANALAN